MPIPTIHNAQIRHGPLKPVNMNRDRRQSATDLGQVFLECIASYSDPHKSKWLFCERELSQGNDKYAFSVQHQDTHQDKYVCEIKSLERPLTGVYKLVLVSVDGRENVVTFNCPLVGIEKCNWTNVQLQLTMDPMQVREIPAHPLVPIK